MEVLAVESVKKTYGQGRLQLNNISMKVEQGDFVALIGPAQAGKTPLLQVITGRKNADDGKITFLGQNIRSMTEEEWKYVAWIPDDLLYYEKRSVRRIFERTISWTGMGNMQYAKELCQKFSIDMEQNVLELSKMQNRCVSFINAVLTRPRLICIDELYHEIDIETYLNMLEILMEMRQKGATVIASFDEYKKINGCCNKFMVLNEGTCKAKGEIAPDYIPPKMVSMNLKSCFKETVGEDEWEEYVELFLHDCRELAGGELNTLGDNLFFPYNGDLTALSHLLYKFGCEDYLVEQMTMEEDHLKNYERWQE
ncbi:MAG: ATP-binding cassette domain-containing protein [Alistipes sp.]|nr:ATP-binding cassette domain-containing protein [Alistipes sp.]